MGVVYEALDRETDRRVAITSLGVRQPYANLALSNTARSGATGFLKTLAREVAAEGITVNSVQPGLHTTARVTSVYGDHPPLADVPAGRAGSPADFGAVVAFLCSAQASYLTGAAISKGNVGFARTAFIGVAFDDYRNIRVFLQEFGFAVQKGAGLRL